MSANSATSQEGHVTENDSISRMQTVFDTKSNSNTKLHFVASQTASLTSRQASKTRVHSVSFQFTANKTIDGFSEKRTKSDQPPKKKRKLSKYPRGNEEKSLTCRKPVTAYVPIDAWAQIFCRSDLKFLVQAQLVCKDFRAILEAQSIWREAREYSFRDLDPQIPQCPPELTEKQYAMLLVGRGCQIKPCTQKLTKKVYWAFMLRMCETCFKDSTQRHDDDSEEALLYMEFASQLEHEVKDSIPSRLTDLLPASNVLGIGGYYTQTRPLNRENQMWRAADESRHYCTLTVEVEKLKQEFRENVMIEPSEFLTWAKQKWNQTRSRIMFARELDMSCRDFQERSQTLREAKQDFFQSQAELLVPPMSDSVLNAMSAYQRALETPNGATQRAWDLLVTKIDKPELRAQAEQLLQWESEVSYWSDEDGLDDVIASHRGQVINRKSNSSEFKEKSEEQEIVLEIAETCLEKLLDVVHDEDLLLMFLEKVRHRYEDLVPKPEGLNSDGEYGQYRLMLDDAHMVINEVLRPAISVHSIVRMKSVLNSLRCMACTRTDCHKTYDFNDLFSHIRQTHARYVGKDMHYWKFAVPRRSRIRSYTWSVAWYQLPWPKSMPALPFHRRAISGMIWDPDEEVEYIQREPEDTVRFFEGFWVLRETGAREQNHASDLVKAVETLVPTRLGDDCIIRIALEYAARREVERVNEHSLELKNSVTQLEKWESALKVAAPKFLLKFMCGLCSKDPKNGSRGKQKRETLYPQTLACLVPHWEKKHRIAGSALQSDLIVLPSDFSLQKTISSEDAKLVREQTRILAKRRSGVENGNMGNITPRENALLEVHTIQDQLAQLFVRRDNDPADSAS